MQLIQIITRRFIAAWLALFSSPRTVKIVLIVPTAEEPKKRREGRVTHLTVFPLGTLRSQLRHGSDVVPYRIRDNETITACLVSPELEKMVPRQGIRFDTPADFEHWLGTKPPKDGWILESSNCPDLWATIPVEKVKKFLKHME